MRWLINETNYAKIKLSPIEDKIVKSLIDKGKVKNRRDKHISATEVTDGAGDLRVDNKMFNRLCYEIVRKPTKL